MKRFFKWASILGGVVVVLLVIASLVPSDVKRLSREYPPIDARSERIPARGCTLTQSVRADGSCEDVHAGAIAHTQVQFPSSIPQKGLARLDATLSIPSRLGPRPAIVLLHGSGPNDRHETAHGDLVTKLSPPVAVFDDLAELFVRAGFVVLRWDKRACLRCYPRFDRRKLGEFRFGDYVQDARDAIAFLRTMTDEVMPNAIVVAGHSEGGQLAPFVAEGDPGVRAVMMLAGLTERFEDGLLAQLGRARDIRARQGDLFGALTIQISRSGIASCTGKLDSGGDPKDGCIGGGVTLEMLSDYRVMVDRMPQVLASLPCPLFAIQGSVDRNIDPTEMQKLAIHLHGRDHELHYVPNVSHSLVDATLDKPTEVSREVKDTILAFLRSVPLTPEK